MVEFNCYDSPLGRDIPLLEPTPCCGIKEPPVSFTATLTISGSGCSPLVPGTYADLVFTPAATCSNIYSNVNSPIGITFDPGFCAGKNGYKSPPVGFDHGGAVVSGPSGSCSVAGEVTTISATITITIGGTCVVTLTVTGVTK